MTIFNGKIHYFYGHFPLQNVSSPEGKTCEDMFGGDKAPIVAVTAVILHTEAEAVPGAETGEESVDGGRLRSGRIGVLRCWAGGEQLIDSIRSPVCKRFQRDFRIS